jgi:acetylserotonin N-methyltransferase
VVLRQAIARLLEIDDRRVYDAYIASRVSAALAASVRIGLFEALDERPRTAEELAQAVRLQQRPVDLLLAALLAMGLVDGDEGVFSLPPDASAYLVRGKPGWLGGLIMLELEHFLDPRTLLHALEHDQASVYGGKDPWAVHAADPSQAGAFTLAMHSISQRPAAGLARHCDFRGITRVLDIGGGSGVVAMSIAEAWPEVRCTVLEMPAVCPHTRHFVAEAGLSDRVEVVAGDMFDGDWPEGHDLVLFSQILHDWPPEMGLELLQNAFAVLPAGGRVLIHEKLVDDDGRGPLANALVNLDMLVWTEGQQYSMATLRPLLLKAGFEAVERQDTVGYWSVIEARKPK